MATLGQVAFRGNAQAFEYLINRTARHPLGELRWLAQEIKRELDKEIPSLLLRVTDEKSKDYQTYLNERYRLVRESFGDAPPDRALKAEVRLVEYDPESETKILAGILFQQMHGTWDQALAKARSLNDAEKKDLFGAIPDETKCAMAERWAVHSKTLICDLRSSWTSDRIAIFIAIG